MVTSLSLTREVASLNNLKYKKFTKLRHLHIYFYSDDKFLYLVKGDVMVFSDNSKLEDKTDVIESMLSSELAADAKKYSTGTEWFTFYQSVMGNLGWTIISSTSSEEFTHESDNTKSHLHEIGKIIVDEISKAAAVGKNLSFKLRNLFKGLLKAGAESQEVALFTEEHGTDEVRKNFFLAGVMGNKTLALVAIELNVDLSSAQTLFYQAKNFDYKVATYVVELNKMKFDQVKEDVETRLGGRLQAFVRPVSGSNTTDPTTPPTCPVSSFRSTFCRHLQISILAVLYFLYKIIA